MNEFKYNIGYALSGGFIKGFAHLGIMQALHEHGIRPEILSGVSAGALAAVFYADGKEPYHIVELFVAPFIQRTDHFFYQQTRSAETG